MKASAINPDYNPRIWEQDVGLLKLLDILESFLLINFQNQQNARINEKPSIDIYENIL